MILVEGFVIPIDELAQIIIFPATEVPAGGVQVGQCQRGLAILPGGLGLGQLAGINQPFGPEQLLFSPVPFLFRLNG